MGKLMKNLSAGMFCCLAAFFSCSEEKGLPSSGIPQRRETFLLEYNLPNTGEKTRKGAYSSYIPSVNADENRVDMLHLLFFEQNEHGNGSFVEMLTGTLGGGSIEKAGSIVVDIHNTGISNDKDYHVLVIANAHKYFANDSELSTFCQDKTENTVRLLLQAKMPVLSPGVYEIPDKLLPMSGSALKSAGKDMRVDLLRAVIRMDVKIADAKTQEYELLEATIRNASPRVPLFSAPADLAFEPLKLNKTVEAPDKVIIRGGMYLPETFRSGLKNLALRKKQSACMLVKCRKKNDTDVRNWYRVDVALHSDGTQYLRRNNAYMVVIKNIKGPGYNTPEEAYESLENLLEVSAVKIEDWEAGADYEGEIDFNQI